MNEPVSFDAPAVERGVGFFETLLVVGRRAILWEPHLARLFSTLSRFDLPAPTRDELTHAAGEALTDEPVERALRLSWIAVGADLERRSSWRLDASRRPIPESTLVRRDGCRGVTLPRSFRRDTPSVKSTSYFAAILGLRHARRNGGDEGLFVAEDGSYLEGTSTALVAWDGLRHAPEALPSVTAAAFLSGDGRLEAPTEEALRGGALLLGSLTKASPLVELDGRPCAVPDALRERIASFNARLVTDETLCTLL